MASTKSGKQYVRLKAGYALPSLVQGVLMSSLTLPASRAMRVGIAVSLLAGYLEVEFVECGLDERNGVFGGTAGCPFIARGGLRVSSKSNLWGDLKTGRSRAGSM